METEIRAGDTEIHPEAVLREEAAVEVARHRRLRFWTGLVGALLCGLAFVVALWRDNTYVLLGSFLGGMVAGNRIPFSEITGVIAAWRGKA